MSSIAELSELIGSFSHPREGAAFGHKEREAEGKRHEDETRRQEGSLAREAVWRWRAVLVLTSLIRLCVLGAAILAQVTTASTQTTAQPPMQEQKLKPKDIFKECAKCPEMVVVPTGAFKMGSPASEPGHSSEESPQHMVTITRPFAVGRFAVTFEEWDACVTDGGCKGYKPSDEGWGRGRRPVIKVSWDDAQVYVAWLSKKTGKSYRRRSSTRPGFHDAGSSSSAPR